MVRVRIRYIYCNNIRVWQTVINLSVENPSLRIGESIRSWIHCVQKETFSRSQRYKEFPTTHNQYSVGIPILNYNNCSSISCRVACSLCCIQHVLQELRKAIIFASKTMLQVLKWYRSRLPDNKSIRNDM